MSYRRPAARLQGDSRRARHGHIRGANFVGMRSRRRHGMFAARHAVGGAALAHDAEVMRRTGGFQLDAAFQRLIVEPVQHPLVLFRSNHLLGGNIHSAADWNQQEGM